MADFDLKDENEEGWEDVPMGGQSSSPDVNKDALKQLMLQQYQDIQNQTSPKAMAAKSRGVTDLQNEAGLSGFLEQLSKASSQMGAIGGQTAQSALGGMGAGAEKQNEDYLNRVGGLEDKSDAKKQNLLKIMGYLSAKDRANFQFVPGEENNKKVMYRINKDTGERVGEAIPVGDLPKKEKNIAQHPFTDEEGNQWLVNTDPLTGKELGRTPLGKGLKQPGSGKEPTQPQYADAGYGKRLEQANDVFDKLEGEGYDPTSTGKYFTAHLPEGLQSSQMQEMNQAKRNFVNAILRKESGAAIAQSEFDSAERQYFPQPGDSPQVLADKKANRLQKLEEFKASAGPAWDKIAKITPDVPKKGGGFGTAQAAPTGVSKGDDGNYYKTGPDGKKLKVVKRLRSKSTGKEFLEFEDGSKEEVK